MIDAVLLDVGGVLWLPDHRRIRAAFARAGVEVDAARLDRAHYVGVAALDDFTEGDREVWATYNRAYARDCEAPEESLDEVVDALLDEFATGLVWSRIAPGSAEALRALASLGVRLAIVSNAEGTAELRLREHGVCQVGPGRGVEVAAVIDSAVVGVAKPDPRIFELALEALGVPADRAVHVGDTPGADVEGARAAGIRPLLLDPYDLHAGLEVERLRSLHDVVDLVATARA